MWAKCAIRGSGDWRRRKHALRVPRASARVSVSGWRRSGLGPAGRRGGSRPETRGRAGTVHPAARPAQSVARLPAEAAHVYRPARAALPCDPVGLRSRIARRARANGRAFGSDESSTAHGINRRAGRSGPEGVSMPRPRTAFQLRLPVDGAARSGLVRRSTAGRACYAGRGLGRLRSGRARLPARPGGRLLWARGGSVGSRVRSARGVALRPPPRRTKLTSDRIRGP
jgi:hypothetical protein